MRVVLLLCMFLCIVLAPIASAQEPPRPGINPASVTREPTEVAGGENLWSYMLFMFAGLGTVYLVFRGNKRA
jgi:hypothetical protein